MGNSGAKVGMELQMDMSYQSTFMNLQARPGLQWQQKNLASDDTNHAVKTREDTNPRGEEDQST